LDLIHLGACSTRFGFSFSEFTNHSPGLSSLRELEDGELSFPFFFHFFPRPHSLFRADVAQFFWFLETTFSSAPFFVRRRTSLPPPPPFRHSSSLDSGRLLPVSLIFFFLTPLSFYRPLAKLMIPSLPLCISPNHNRFMRPKTFPVPTSLRRLAFFRCG